MTTCADYDALIDALRARKAELGLSDAQLDEFIGWAGGYTGKVLSDARVKRLGPRSLFELLSGLGLMLAVLESPAATDDIRRRFKRRVVNNVRAGMSRISPRMRRKLMSELGRSGAAVTNARFPPSVRRVWHVAGGTASWAKLSKRARSKKAKAMAAKRWHPPEVTEVKNAK